MEREADRLAKALSPFLGEDFTYEDLRARGWFTFLQFDRPLTNDPIEMACEAWLYMFRDADHSTRLHALRRVVAYICFQSGRPMPSAGAIRAASGLLATPALDNEAVRAWFKDNCH